MKKLLSKRWHRVPVVLASVLLMLVLTAGSAFAWYTVTVGTAEVTVNEAISYEVTGQTSGEFVEPIWTVSIMPGETEIIYMTVSNASSAALDVVANYTIDPADEGLTVTGNAGIALDIPVTLPGNGSGPFSIEVHAAGDVPVQPYTVTFTLERQSPST